MWQVDSRQTYVTRSNFRPQGPKLLQTDAVAMALTSLFGERHVSALQAWPATAGGGRRGVYLTVTAAIDLLQVRAGAAPV